MPSSYIERMPHHDIGIARSFHLPVEDFPAGVQGLVVEQRHLFTKSSAVRR